MKLKYPDLNVEEEWEACQIWYRDHNKQIKSPSLALRNWMQTAQEKKDRNKNTLIKGVTHQPIDTSNPDRFNNQKYDHLIHR